MPTLFSKKILLALLGFFSMARIQAITYYLSPNGNDSNSGTTISSAWKTISKLNSINLLPGTTVLFEGGKTFSGSIYLDALDGNNSINPVVISSYGSGKAIIQSGGAMGLYAYNTKGLEVSDLIFEGSGMTSNTTDGVKIHTDLGGNVKLSAIRLINLEIKNYGVVGVCVYSSNYNTGFKDVLIDKLNVHDVKENGIFVKGYTSPTHIGWSHENVIIRNTEVHHIPGYADPNSHRGSGIIMAQVDIGVIENCVAHHNGTSNMHCGGPGGIWVYDSNNITIQHCESYSNSAGTGCDGLGFDLDGGITNSIMQYNYSHNNDGAGYLLGQYEDARPWANNTVRYNISENDGRTNSGGITLFKGPNSTMNGCKIYHNTVYTSASAANSGAGAFTITDWNTGINGIEVYNNIFETGGGAYLADIPVGYSAVFAGNLYWADAGAFKIKYHGTNYSSLVSWRAASGYEQVGTSASGISADPLLNNVGGGSIVWPLAPSALTAYSTLNSSPVINAALDLSSLFSINGGSVDFFNSALPASNLRDVGAYENAASITTALAEQTNSRETIRFYPNPVNAGDMLHISGGEAPYAFELYGLNGTSLYKETLVNSQFYIPQDKIISGLYILVITDQKKQRVSGKIIVR